MLLNFDKIPKSDILFLDNNLLNLKIKNKSSIIYNFNEIRVYYLIIAIFDFCFKNENLNFKQVYKKKIYEAISPKVAISEYINQRSFEFKFLMPGTKVITYQFSFINNRNDILKKYKYKKTDYFFVFSTLEKKLLSKIFQAKFIVSGSCISNSVKKMNKIKYDICYISEFNNHKNFSKKSLKQINKAHNDNQKIIVKNISYYCKKNKKKFVIALRTNRRDKNKNNFYNNETEINYYKEIISKNFKYEKNVNSYTVADKSKLIVCLSSALGIEMLGRQKKVLFLPFDQIIDKKNRKNPYFKFKTEKTAFIKKNPNKIIGLIDKYLELNKKEWTKYKNKNFYDLSYNYQNKLLKEKIIEIVNAK
tara:strand:- start:376 stop:1461 length:1086 start_codon:yes stop_codon:yes gene_type:complete